MRTIDLGHIGKPITGIWEIGPIISCDRWIPDVLCRNLNLVRGWHSPGDLKSQVDAQGRYSYEWAPFYKAPTPEPPKPMYEYYVDYCVFFGSGVGAL